MIRFTIKSLGEGNEKEEREKDLTALSSAESTRPREQSVFAERVLFAKQQQLGSLIDS